MTSLFERLTAASAATQENPHAFALGNLDAILAEHAPEVRRALEAAAVPNIWDGDLLGRILDPDLAADAAQWTEKLQSLPVVERIPGSASWAVHEVTRLALRDQLHSQGRLAVYASRALRAIGPLPTQPTVADEIERLYHQLVAEPEVGAEVLENSWWQWEVAGRHASLNLLAATLEELLPHLAVPARAVALLRDAVIRESSRPATQILEQASEALRLLTLLGHRRRQADALNLIGDIHTTLGRLDDARCAFEDALKLRQDLLEIDPSVARWQRDLSVSFNNLGELATAQGNLPEAQRLFGEALRIRQPLAESDSANAEWQRDLSVSFETLGDLAMAQGNLPEAQRLFSEALRIAQPLAESDPANAEWQRDVSVSFSRLGNLATNQGDLPEAQRLFGEDLHIAQRLAESDPANAKWQRDLSVSFETLGNLAMAQGNLPEAQRLFGEALRIRQRLSESDPANAAWRRDLSVSFNKLGELASAQGNLPEAQRLFGEELRIVQRLADSDPPNAAWQRDLSVSHFKLANLARANGNDAGFKVELQECFQVLNRMKQRGLHFDPQMARIYEQLAAMLADDASQ